MKEFIPEGDAVLCEPVDEPKTADGEFVYDKTDVLPMYRVLKTGLEGTEPEIVPGDVVVCDSRGNKFISDGRTYHIFSYKNIIGKLRHE